MVIDDHLRLAYAELLDDLTAACAIAFLRRAVEWFAARGVTVRAVMSDNDSCHIAHDYAAGLEVARALPAQPSHPGF